MRDYCLLDQYRDDINRTTSSSKGALITGTEPASTSTSPIYLMEVAECVERLSPVLGDRWDSNLTGSNPGRVKSMA